MEIKNLPVGIQTFSKLIKGNYLYVDKTREIYNLLEGFFEAVKSVYASIPYNIFVDEREGNYHMVIYLILKLMGINIKSEVQTNLGRINAVVETEELQK